MRMFDKMGGLALFLIVIYVQSALADRWTQFLPVKNVLAVEYDRVSQTYWFGTANDGLWRFNGRQSSRLYLPEKSIEEPIDQITALAIDENRRELWIGTPKGLLRYHLVSESWDYYDDCSGLSQNWITTLFVDKNGTLWYGSESEDARMSGGVGKRDLTGWYRYTTEGYAKWNSSKGCPQGWELIPGGIPIPSPSVRNKVDAIARDSQGKMYFGTRGGGLCILDAAGMWRCTVPSLVSSRLTIKTIAIDHQDNKWLGTLGGVCLLDSLDHLVKWPNGEECLTSMNSPLASDTINAIWIEAFYNGDIKWFGTINGVSMLDSTNNLWKTFKNENSGLAANIVQDIVGDNDGNLWFALQQFGGVSKLNNKWSELTKEDGLRSDFVLAVEKDNWGRLWVGTIDPDSSVEVLDHGVWKRRRLDNIQCPVSDFLPDSMDMWVATLGCGLYKLSDNLGVAHRLMMNDTTGFPADNVLALAARHDTLWAGTDEGLVRLITRPKAIVDSIFLESRQVAALAYDLDGRLWVGTNRGLCLFNGNQCEESGLPAFVRNIAINAIGEGRTGAMWVGTNNGLVRYASQKWTRFSTIDGLPDDRIKAVGAAADGTIWCGTVNGAAAFDGARWTAYTTNDGLSNNFVFQTAFDPDPMDVLVWFATYGRGISRYRKTQVLPETYFVEVFDVVSETNVTFHYSGYDFNTPTLDLRYQWAFVRDENCPDPKDKTKWSAITSALNVTLPVEADGLHNFCICAIDKDGNVDTTAAKLRFYKVRPHQGGAVTIVDATHAQKLDSLWIYVPPNALPLGSTMRATPVVVDTIGFASKKRRFTGIAFDVGPHDLSLNQKKPLTLAIFYRPSVVKQNETNLTIYHRESDWQRVGGSIDSKRHAITTTITQLDTIALFEELTSDQGSPGVNLITNVAAQPRVFSPNGRSFLDRVTISFDLGRSAEVTAKVYNLSGRLVRALCENRSMNPGRNVIEWDGRDLYAAICLSGLYVVTIKAAGYFATKQVVVMNE